MTLALVNGRLLVPADPHVRVRTDEARTALLVDDGRIAAIGDDRSVLAAADGRAEVVDLGGATVAPGFVDAHIHLFGCALDSLAVSLLPEITESLAVIGERLADRARDGEGWILGKGYDDMRLTEQRHPTRTDLDDAVGTRPALVERVCGHMSVASTTALALAGIDGETPDPSGGAIVRDAAGHPTGLLLERAQELVRRLVPPPGEAEIRTALRTMGQTLVAYGVTSICEAFLGGHHPREVEIWADVLADDWPGPRVVFLVGDDHRDSPALSRLDVRGTKFFADGVVTGRTAALSEPFEHDGGIGMLIHEPQELDRLVGSAAARGAVGIHAMGDHGIDVSIDAIERAGSMRPPGAFPHRIEHFTLPSESAIRRAAALGIVPVPQPVFLQAEGEAYRAQLGEERVARTYPLRTMLAQGLRPALSSDAPATSAAAAFDPWLGIRAAVTRTTWAGGVLGTAETISVAEAIACYTANGGAALGLEDRIGALRVGADADLVVFGDDPLGCAVDDLGSLRPEMVFVAGRQGSVQRPGLR